MPKKKGCVMTKNVPAFIARTQFGQILERASKNNERFLVTKKGEAKAIILGVEDYLRTMVETPESISTLHKSRPKRAEQTNSPWKRLKKRLMRCVG
jgi:prevent-host-death family protein